MACSQNLTANSLDDQQSFMDGDNPKTIIWKRVRLHLRGAWAQAKLLLGWMSLPSRAAGGLVGGASSDGDLLQHAPKSVSENRHVHRVL